MFFHTINDEDARALRMWWSTLDENRGDRAQLRRAVHPDDVLLTPAFAHFVQSMPNSWAEGKSGKGTHLSMSDMALVAAVLARVKTDSSTGKDEISFARALASPKDQGSKAAMSELRFSQLQKSRTPEEFFTRICRAVNLLGGKVSVASLGDNIIHWLTEFRFGTAIKPENRIAVRWANDYYSVYKD